MLKRAAVAGLCSALALVCLGFVWALRPTGQMSTPDLVIAFAGLTNDISTGTLVRFDVANVSGRRVLFGVGGLQIHQRSGWPPPSMLGAGTGEWLEVGAGSNVVFSVRAPSSEEATWRVPLIYQKDRWLMLAALDRIEGVNLGKVHWHWRHRAPVCRFVVGPEMVGVSTYSETR